MAMTDRKDDFAQLEGFFEAARTAAPEPSEALRARILSDAEAARPQPARPVRASAPARGRSGGFWRLFIPALGGPGVMAGFVGATLAGAWLGFVQPAPIAGLAQQVTGQATTLEQVDLLPSFDTYLTADSGD